MQQRSHPQNRPVILAILDGLGVAPPGPGNAVTLAETPNLDNYWHRYPHTYLEASGVHVGLPPNVDGNSEVGHTVIGAGKVVFQDLPRIDNAIQNGSFFHNPALQGAFAHAQKNNSSVHLIGLISEGEVHASFEHFQALITMAVREKQDPDKLFVHMFTDGRDSYSKDAAKYIELVETECLRKRMGRLVSIVGRAYAMDRDEKWYRTQLAYDLLTRGNGHVVIDVRKYLQSNYSKGNTDEYLEPATLLLNRKDKPVVIEENDAVIFFNFRTERARQLTEAFIDEDFDHFERKKLANLYFTGLTRYTKEMQHVAFPQEPIERTLGKVISENQLSQLRITESEKFAHVTYFFNGEDPQIHSGETWVEIPSPKDVQSYDEKPEMSQEWVTDELLKRITEGHFDFVVVNYAAPDMVAHTGVIDATVEAIETTDKCLGHLVTEVMNLGGTVIVTADHGNAEEMINLQTGEPDTKHSVNQVPFLVIGGDLNSTELAIGNLADIAPTVLHLLNLPKPPEMTGRNLLDKFKHGLPIRNQNK